MKEVLFFAALLALATPIRADDPINAERPGFTNGAGTVTRFQYESGVTRYRGNGSRTIFNDGGLLRIPGGKNLEARIGVPSRSVSAWSDPSVGFKWRALDDGPGKVGVALGATGVSHGGPQFAIEAEHALSPLWNVQADFVRSAGTSAGGLNVGYAASKTLGVFAETYAQSDGRYIDGGVTLLSGKNLQLDLNAGTGADSGNRTRSFVGVGIARRF